MTEPSYAEVAQEAADEIARDANKAGATVGDKLEKDAHNASKDAEKAAQDLKSQAKDAVNKAGTTAKKLQEDLKKAEKDAADKIKKEYNEKKGPVIEFFKAIAEKVSATATYLVNTTTKGTHKATEELKNPVVATQAVVTVGAITGLVIGIQERAKIFRYKSDCEITAILAGLVGLVVLDGLLFTKYYPKYDKKSLK